MKNKKPRKPSDLRFECFQLQAEEHWRQEMYLVWKEMDQTVLQVKDIRKLHKWLGKLILFLEGKK